MRRQKELVFFIENYSSLRTANLAGKYARTYMNKFAVSEDDQFEISNVHILDSSTEEKCSRKIDRVIKSIKKSDAADLDLLLFGLYGVKNRPKNERGNEIRQICARCLKDVNSNIHNLRISFIDMNTKMDPRKSRIVTEDVNDLYAQTNRSWKISLNNDLEAYYEKCMANGFSKNEFVYFFHAELLSAKEFEAYHEQAKILETQEYHSKLDTIHKRTSKLNKIRFEVILRKKYTTPELNNIQRIRNEFEAAIDKSRKSEFWLYRGDRVTLVFQPKRGLPNAGTMHKLSNDMTQMLSRSHLHVEKRDVDAVSISPTSTPDIEVFGFRRHTPSQKLRDSLPESPSRYLIDFPINPPPKNS